MTDNRPGFDILHALAQSNPHNRRSLRHSERRERGGKTPEVMRILGECSKIARLNRMNSAYTNALILAGILAGSSTTVTPAASRAAIFSRADPVPLEIMAPA